MRGRKLKNHYHNASRHPLGRRGAGGGGGSSGSPGGRGPGGGGGGGGGASMTVGGRVCNVFTSKKEQVLASLVDEYIYIYIRICFWHQTFFICHSIKQLLLFH